jgi:hypothetical protein
MSPAFIQKYIARLSLLVGPRRLKFYHGIALVSLLYHVYLVATNDPSEKRWQFWTQAWMATAFWLPISLVALHLACQQQTAPPKLPFKPLIRLVGVHVCNTLVALSVLLPYGLIRWIIGVPSIALDLCFIWQIIVASMVATVAKIAMDFNPSLWSYSGLTSLVALVCSYLFMGSFIVLAKQVLTHFQVPHSSVGDRQFWVASFGLPLILELLWAIICFQLAYSRFADASRIGFLAATPFLWLLGFVLGVSVGFPLLGLFVTPVILLFSASMMHNLP